MRIFEITNYFDNLPSNNTSVLIGDNEIKLNDFMAKHGFRELSSMGFFSQVYEHPNFDYVLKVFVRNDIAYSAFLRFCESHKSEHLPKFRGKKVVLNYDYSAIRMERLLPAVRSDVIIKFIEWVNWINLVWEKDSLEKFLEEFQELGLPLSVYDIVMKLVVFARANEFNLDFNLTNLMMRGDVLVFIDPFR